MLKRLLEMLRSERHLSAEVRAQLVDGLFHPFASLIAGALASAWIAATVTLVESDPVVTTIADIIVVIALARIAIGVRYLAGGAPAMKGHDRLWERTYSIGAGAFALALGLVCLTALTRIDNTALHLMLTTTTAGYAASITGRNAGRPWVALSQLYLAAGPMCLGLFMHDTMFYKVMAVALFVFMFGMTDITVSVRKTLVTALETRRRNADLAKSFEAQAQLFDDALNNMSHGLCMFDAEGGLLVWNAKFLSIVGRKGEKLEKGMSIDDLTGWLQECEDRKHDIQHLCDSIRLRAQASDARQNFVKLGAEQVVSVSSQKMDNGNTVIVFEDVTEQAKANERIQQLAWTDELTGLMNRAAFQELFQKNLKLRDAGQRLALHLIDLDHFKEVNDTLGHPMGDLLLQEVADRISTVSGEQTQVGRLGGDEFVVIQPLPDESAEPETLANAIIAELGRTFFVAEHRINIGASIGIAIAPTHGEKNDILLKRADMALYKAKAHGRNSAVVFENDLDFQAQERRLLELDIRAAISENQFSLVFQPIANVQTGKIELFETLIRWKHPARGFVSPAEFIPVAEETGLVTEIGRWVLREACANAAKWKGGIAVAVNFSAVQFTDRQFPEFLAETLRDTGMTPERLELEVTETALLDDNPETRDMLARFREMGIKVSLDDFGTGYSSLSQLRTFPFSKIKVDGSFVRDLGRDPSAGAVIHAVTSIGKILGMAVVAECVESEDQLSFLVDAGCTHIQGYLLGKPEPASRVPDILNAHSIGWVKQATKAA